MRDIDRLMDHVRECEYIRGPVIKQAIINRLEDPPTREELDRARDQLYGQHDSFLESQTVAETRNVDGKSILDEDMKPIERDGK